MTIGSIVGKGINGTTNEYPTNKSNRTGATGKRAGIGRSKILGVSKVCNPERDHNSRLKRSDHNLKQLNHKFERQPNHNNREHNPERSIHSKPDHHPERSNHSTHSHNAGRYRNNLNIDRKNLKRRKKKNRIESRMIKGLPDYIKRLVSIKGARVTPSRTKGDLVTLGGKASNSAELNLATKFANDVNSVKDKRTG